MASTYVFLFFFAFGFLLVGRRPILALSTRIVLVVLLGCALAYAISANESYHGIAAMATLIVNVLFVAFAAIDFVGWQKRQAGRELS